MARRATSVPVEFLASISGPVRATSVPVEFLAAISGPVRVTSAPVEYLADPSATLFPGGDFQATQLVGETAEYSDDPPARASQLTIESLQDAGDTSTLPLRAFTSQLAIETLRDVSPQARPTQLVLEVIRTIDAPLPLGPRGFYFGRVGGNDILKYGLDHRDDP